MSVCERKAKSCSHDLHPQVQSTKFFFNFFISLPKWLRFVFLCTFSYWIESLPKVKINVACINICWAPCFTKLQLIHFKWVIEESNTKTCFWVNECPFVSLHGSFVSKYTLSNRKWVLLMLEWVFRLHFFSNCVHIFRLSWLILCRQYSWKKKSQLWGRRQE